MVERKRERETGGGRGGTIEDSLFYPHPHPLFTLCVQQIMTQKSIRQMNMQNSFTYHNVIRNRFVVRFHLNE